MRSVRCDACGKRALIAASQCPQCGHLFDLRDSFGELIPLAHCQSCDSDYPLGRGECKWCGTRPSRRRLGPVFVRGIMASAFLVLGVGAWLAGRTVPAEGETGKPRMLPAEVRLPAAIVAPALSLVASVERTDSQPTAVPDSLRVDSTAVQPPDPVALARDVDPAPKPAAATRSVRPGPAPTRPAAASRRVRWVPVVARTWVPVRVRANPQARVLAAIGPDTRVEVLSGGSDWVRLRTRGLTGWVERRYFFD